jgi:hypothetical protein
VLWFSLTVMAAASQPSLKFKFSMPKLPPPAPASVPAATTPSTIEKQPSRVRVKVEAAPFNPALSQRARALAPTLQQIMGHLERWDAKQQIFYVVPTDAEVAGYSTVVKRGMAFNIMRSNIARGLYEDIATFGGDFLLMVDNALLFNPPGSPVHKHAVKLLREGRKLLLPHWAEMGPQADARLSTADAARAAIRAGKKAAAVAAANAAAAAASSSSAAAAGAGNSSASMGGSQLMNQSSSVAGIGGSKRARVSRRVLEADDEEDAVEAEEVLAISKYKNVADLSHLLPAAVGPLRVPGLGEPLRRRYLYAKLAGKAAGSSEELSRETSMVASWRKRLYGEAAPPAALHMTSRPLLVVDTSGGVRRTYGVDVAPDMTFDVAPRVDLAVAAHPAPTKRALLFPSKLPKAGREMGEAEDRLRENGFLLHRLKLYTTWYPESQLRGNEDYVQLVQQLEENFLALLGVDDE